jgi:hypothetical protein
MNLVRRVGHFDLGSIFERETFECNTCLNVEFAFG